MKYKVEVKLAGGSHKGEGNNIYDALDNIGLTWADIKSKGEVIVKYGKKKSTKLYSLPLTRRLFTSRPFRIMQAKYLESLLK